MRRWITVGREWREGFALLLMLGGPMVLAFGFPPAGWRLARPWYYGGDFTQYLSAMHQGMAGAWRIVDRFSPEPHPPVIQYPFYVFLGHLARWLRFPPEALYAAAAIVGFLALWGALHRSFAHLLPDPRMSPVATALVLSSGPAWILPLTLRLAGLDTPWGEAALEAATRIELNPFLALMAPPHLMFALAVWLALLPTLSRPPTGFSAREFFGIAAAMTLLALWNPFSLVPLWVGLGVRTILALWERRRAALSGLVQAVALALLAAPLIGYQWETFQRHPFWGIAYGQQNLQPAYPLPLTLLAYGGLGVLGGLGAFRAWILRDRPAGFRERFLSLTAGGLLAASSLPLPYARRFAYGLGPLLAVLGAPIAADLAKRPGWTAWSSPARRRVIRGAALGILLYSQNAFLYIVYVLSALGTGPFSRALFEPVAAFEAAEWLRAQGPTVVVLACEEDGNFLAGWIEGRVVLGHAGATVEVARKREEVAAFFSGRLSPAERAALIRRYGVTHIYERTDRPCDGWQPAGAPAFERPPVRIFRVEGTP